MPGHITKLPNTTVNETTVVEITFCNYTTSHGIMNISFSVVLVSELILPCAACIGCTSYQIGIHHYDM